MLRKWECIKPSKMTVAWRSCSSIYHLALKCHYFIYYKYNLGCQLKFLSVPSRSKSRHYQCGSIFIKMLIQNLRVILLEMDQVEQDPDFTALSRQFKATAMELISVLEQVQFKFDLQFTYLIPIESSAT